MEAFVAICAVVVSYVIFLGYRGHKVLGRRDSLLRQIRETDKTELQYLDLISYHGGLPEIPKPQKLNIAISKDYLLLFTNSKHFFKLAFRRWKSIETFTTKRKDPQRNQNLFSWGPFSQLLNRQMLRHFIVVHYVDSENQENHLLMEHPSREKVKEVYERLYSASRLSAQQQTLSGKNAAVAGDASACCITGCVGDKV